MINKRIVASGMSIATALAVMTGATFAFFTDTSSSTDNVFSTGTLELELSSNGDPFTLSNVSATFGDSGMAPGESSPVGTLTIRNGGSIPADHAEIDFSNTNSDLGNPLSDVMRVTTLTFDGVNVLAGLDDIIPNAFGLLDTDNSGFLELDELAAQDLNDLPVIGVDPVDYDLTMGVTLDPLAGNQYQGDQVTVNLDVLLTQEP